MALLEVIETQPLCGDGAIEMLLRERGVPTDGCLEALCISCPEIVREIHVDYVKAGAQIIRTNTFGANAVQMRPHGLSNRVNEINWQAAQLARQAAREAFVAGSVGPVGISSSDAEHQCIDREDCFRTQIGALLEGGVDLIFFEAFRNIDELLLALHVKQSLHHCPAICSLSASDDRQASGNVSLEVAFEKLVRHDAEVLGINCITGAETVLRLTEKIVRLDLPLAVYPDAGVPDGFRDCAGQALSSAGFAQLGVALAERGVRIIGGCCGTTPAHIAALSKALAERLAL